MVNYFLNDPLFILKSYPSRIIVLLLAGSIASLLLSSYPAELAKLLVISSAMPAALILLFSDPMD